MQSADYPLGFFITDDMVSIDYTKSELGADMTSMEQRLLTTYVTLNSIMLESVYGARGRGAVALRNVIEKSSPFIGAIVSDLATNMALSGHYPRYHTEEYALTLPDTPTGLKNVILFWLDDASELLNELVLRETDEPEFDAMLVRLSTDTDYVKWLFVTEEF